MSCHVVARNDFAIPWGGAESDTEARDKINLKISSTSMSSKQRVFNLVSIFILCAAAFLPGSLGRPHSDAVSCKFSIPSTNASGSCDEYDLSAFTEIVTWPFFNANHSYIFSLCANVPTSATPAPCKNTSEAVAYQYFNNSKSCYRLGSLNSVSVVRVY